MAITGSPIAHNRRFCLRNRLKLDFNTGSVRFLGPITKEAKEHHIKALARREEAQHEVSEFASSHRSAQTDKEKQMWLEEWHFEQRMFDIIIDSTSERYKVKLKDGSYHPDASRKGETLKEFVEDRKRPKSERRWGDHVED